MRTLILCVVVGLALGLAVQWWPRASGEGIPAELVDDASVRPMQTQRPLIAERSSEELTAASTAHSGLGALGRGAPAKLGADAPAPGVSFAEDRSDKLVTGAGSVAGSERDRIQQLVAAGFTRERAEEILQKTAQLRRAVVEREYAATGAVRALNASSPTALEQLLRREMGDGEYEKYLDATGKTTRIRVGDVESDSAAANAGIMPGDEILMYADRRVFNQQELNALMLKTSEGETIKTTIVRNGQTMQLYVSGGALGIAQSRAQ